MIYFDLSSQQSIIDNHYLGLENYLKRKLNESSLNSELTDYIRSNLKDIITSQPIDLIRINKVLKGHKKYSDRVANKISKIFNYKNFITKSDNGDYDAYALASNLDIRTCLYCNRIYTVTVGQGRRRTDKLTRPEFDHFFDKKMNPLLALSIYNLIPSCKICNSTLKGRKQFTLKNYVHPYINDFVKDYKYTFAPYDVQSIIGGSSNLSVNLALTTNDIDSIKMISNSSNVFKLIEIYSSHSEELKDIFDIRYRFSDRYFEELTKKYVEIGLKYTDVYRIVFGTYFNETDYSKRPFSKLKKDILVDLSIITKT